MGQIASFLLGIAAAWAIPTLGRVIRPMIVEAAVAGMAVFDETKRVVAEQVEMIEDLAAEARVRREESLAQSNGHYATDEETAPDDEATLDEAPTRERARRRTEGAGRRRPA